MMETKFEFTDMDGVEHTVEFSVIETEHEYRRYGIQACMLEDGVVKETVQARERFITLGEAKATLKMLCACQVMPNTLRDVI